MTLAGTAAGCSPSGAGGGPAKAAGGSALTKAWSIPSDGSDDQIVGSWLTDTLLVRAGSTGGVRAYRVTDGSEAYRVDPGPGGSVPCGMSGAPSLDGIGIVAFGTGPHACTRLTGVDSRTGRVVWSVPLDSPAHDPVDSVLVYVRGDVATVVGDGVLQSLDIATGNRAWSVESRGSGCEPYDWAAVGGVVLVDDYCSDTEPRITLRALDSATGHALWQEPEQQHVEIAQLFTADPLTAVLHESAGDALVRFGSDGRTTRFDTGSLQVSLGNGFPGDQAARTLGHTLVLVTRDGSGNAGVAAFDLVTGARLWTYTGEGRAGATLMDASADGKLYAVSAAGGDGGQAHVVRLDPATGRPTVLSSLPSGPDGWPADPGAVRALPGGGVVSLDALAGKSFAVAYR